MKKISNIIPDWILLPVMGIIFLMIWPILFIFLGSKSLFSSKSSDSEKITGAKVALLTIVGIVVFLIYSRYQYTLETFYGDISNVFIPFIPWIIVGLAFLLIFERIIRNFKWLKRDKK